MEYHRRSVKVSIRAWNIARIRDAVRSGHESDSEALLGHCQSHYLEESEDRVRKHCIPSAHCAFLPSSLLVGVTHRLCDR